MVGRPTIAKCVLQMKTVNPPTQELRLPRYGGAALLTVISAVCLTFSYVHEGSFLRILRVALGLSLPWVGSWLLPRKRSYWSRLAFCYIVVVVIGVVLVLISPFVELFLMDSGLA
jgi:hypothetical protein